MKHFLLSISIFFSLSVFGAGGDSDYEQTEEATHLPAMIMLDEGEDIDGSIAELESLGVTVLRHRGNILLTLIPYDSEFMTGSGDETENSVDPGESGDEEGMRRRLRANRSFGRIEVSLPGKNLPTMKDARLFNDAWLINEGSRLPSPYTGKGVVVGICDIGIDTRHPNFLSSDGKECRIRKVIHYREQQGMRDVYETPEEIYEWQTDTSDDWHATHVTGIAAGAYRAPITYYYDEAVVDSCFHGLAYDADIVFTGSQLSDVGLLAGVEDIIEFAKREGKPAVINLSMGNYTGPHDGTSLFTQYLDRCADDAIICLSAGNEGATNETKSMSYDFSESKSVVRVLTTDWDGIEQTGVAEVWSTDDTPFDFNFFIQSAYGRNDDRLFENWHGGEDGQVTYRMSADPEDPDYNEAFAAVYREGYVKAEAGVSPLNGRYSVSMEFVLKTDFYQDHNGSEWADFWPGIIVGAQPGTHVDIYAGAGCFLRGASGYPTPDNNQNISDLATGMRTISVGSMNNTNVYSDSDLGQISPFSSFGTLIDGRRMPMTIAPGAFVYSSISSAFLEKYPDELQYVDYYTDYNGKRAYWIGDLGTSMSCPFVVGVIATWLQAFPQLTPEQAIEIIQTTNRREGYPDPDNPRHGQGWFEGYKGMLQVMELAGTLNVGSPDSVSATLRVEGGKLIIGNPTGSRISIDIYTPAGMLVDRATVSDNIGFYSLSHLPKGIYVIKASGQTLKIFL